MQIWNSCNALNITGNPIKNVNVKLIFLSWASKVVIDPPQVWYLVEILETLLLHVLSNDGHKFVINLFCISWESFKNVHLLHFPYCKCRFWNGCNAFNTAGSPIKDMNAELSFLELSITSCDWPPQFWHLLEILEILLLYVLSNEWTCKFCS